MAIVRWNPFGEHADLTHALNRMFSDSLLGQDYDPVPSMRQVAINLRETETAFELETMLPGVDPADVEIHISNGQLTIKGDMKKEVECAGDYLCRECFEGSFYRQVSLPSAVLADQAEATAHNGILTISIPKAPEAQPRKIEIKTRDASPQAVESRPVKTVAAKAAKPAKKVAKKK